MDMRELKMSPEAERTVLEHDGDFTLTKMNCLPGLGPAPHSHVHKQVIYVLSGKGIFQRGDERLNVEAGDHVAIPSNVPHTFYRVDEEICWLEFFTPGREDLAGQPVV